MEKIVFLDLDGVIAHRHYTPNGKGLVDEFDPACIARFRKEIS